MPCAAAGVVARARRPAAAAVRADAGARTAGSPSTPPPGPLPGPGRRGRRCGPRPPIRGLRPGRRRPHHARPRGLAGAQQRGRHRAAAQEVSRPGYADRGLAAGAPRRRRRARAPRSPRCCRTAPARTSSTPTTIEALLRHAGRLGRETVARFAVPWWYRTDFATPAGHRRATPELVINGVVGEADVWVNGTGWPPQHTVQGAYTQLPRRRHRRCWPRQRTRWRCEVTRTTRSRCSPSTTSTGPRSRPTRTPASSSRCSCRPRRRSRSATRTSSSTTPPTCRARRAHRQRPRSPTPPATRAAGTVSALVAAAERRRRADVRQQAASRSPAGTTRTVTSSPAEHPALRVHHPQVWWPYRMGAPAAVHAGHRTRRRTAASSDSQHAALRRAHRHQLAGRRVAARAAAACGSTRSTAARSSCAAAASTPTCSCATRPPTPLSRSRCSERWGSTRIRLEGHFMPEDFYDQMDARRHPRRRLATSAATPGSCRPTSRVSAKQLDVLAASAATLARTAARAPERLHLPVERQQPDSDEQEAVTLHGLPGRDFDVPVLASAEYKSSPHARAGRGEGGARTTGCRRTTGTTASTPTTPTTPA